MKFAFGIPHNGSNFVYPYINSLIGLCLTQAQRPFSILVQDLKKLAESYPEIKEPLEAIIKKAENSRLLGSILPNGGPYVDDNRSAIGINLCTKTTDEWVVMVDPDIEFPIDMLDKMAVYIEENPDAKIISCRVNLLNGLPIFYAQKHRKNLHLTEPFDGLREFELAGTGIIFIHRDVFVKMREKMGHHHFFARVMSKEGKMPAGMLYGDDFSFCLKARNIGFKIHGCWDIHGLHWKTHPCPQNYPDKDKVEIKLG